MKDPAEAGMGVIQHSRQRRVVGMPAGVEPPAHHSGVQRRGIEGGTLRRHGLPDDALAEPGFRGRVERHAGIARDRVWVEVVDGAVGIAIDAREARGDQDRTELGGSAEQHVDIHVLGTPVLVLGPQAGRKSAG